MLRPLITAILTLLFALSLQAQALRPSSELKPINSVQKIVLPLKNNATLLAKELKERRKGRPNTFAVAETRDIKTDTHGTWESTKSGFDVWRLVIHSEAAHTLNLGFDKFFLPETAQLFLYDIDKNMVLPPFSAKDNDDHMQLWTPAIEGDQLVLELHIAPDEIDDLQLRLKYINHDFVGITQASVSGSCNVDVICGEADGYPEVDQYRDIIQAAATYSIAGIETCSGSLINNTRNDGKPYFLTADHCGISVGNSPSVVVYWNYFNSYCRIPDSAESGQNGDGERIEFNSGATFRAANGTSDFLLIEMDDPLDPNHNLFLSGWNREPDDFSGGIAIHHPNTEEKRISFEDDPLVYMHPDLPNINVTDTTMIIVDDWDLGTTEGGSSGSPLYNKEKQLVGQLYGGFAACGNDRYDRYGWLGYSWEGGGTPDTQLKVWLDPDDQGLTQMEGLNGAVTLISQNSIFDICTLDDDIAVVNYTSNGFDNDIQLTVLEKPNDVTVDFSNNPLAIDQDLEITISNISALAEGAYTIKILADDMDNDSEVTIRFNVFSGIPLAPLLSFPADGEMDISPSIEFNWENTDADTYDFQIADSQDFSNILLTQNGISQNLFNIDFLDEDKTYCWRVRNSNLCGTSDWSAPSCFSVGIQKCFTHRVFDNLPAVIDEEDPDEIDISFDLEYNCNISDINVLKLKGLHSFVSDLRVTLSNAAKSVVLMNGICGTDADFDLGFDDISPPQIPCPPTDGNLYQPAQPLRSFNSEDLAGSWDMKVEDTEFFDGGEVQEIVMEYCYTSVTGSTIIPLNNYIQVCEDGSIDIPFYFYNLDLAQVSINLGGAGFTLATDISDPTIAIITVDDLSTLGTGLNQIQIGIPGTVIANVYIDLIDFAAEDLETQLIFPDPNSTIAASAVDQLIWDEIPVADNYLIEISDDENFINILFSDNSALSEIDLNISLEAETTYYVRITTISPCGNAMKEFQFTTDGSTSTANLEVDINIFPNPADQLITATTNSIIEKLYIYNTNGKLILQNAPFSESCQIETADLTDGLYILRLKSSTGTMTQKIVIQHER